eukprot:TRINITY_DN801_c1_g1_i25.p2 TRINITY_DN801_c1_g1~~TRINITY_DN801_c1_g1_i25.p2  ORF type:complete len:131 (-),score=26.30 TRINITY_DN801_c1_g1_i25:51-443(-)
MAIASSFSIGLGTGISTGIAVFIHEIPHEIGDLAILVKAGTTPKKVIIIQFFTAVGALIGSVFGIFAGSLGTLSATHIILPFTAGGFVYVATVDVVPHLFEGTNLVQSLKELLAFLVGVSVMTFIAFVME